MMSGLSARAMNCFSMLSPPTSNAMRKSLNLAILRANVSVCTEIEKRVNKANKERTGVVLGEHECQTLHTFGGIFLGSYSVCRNSR